MRRGFTLIELLVVLAIVGVLAALLLPVMSGCVAETTPPETSVTFVGTVVSTQDVQESDGDDGYVTVHYTDVQPQNGQAETFTIDEGLGIQSGSHYAFRVWDSHPHRHISEAIQIPKGW